ncbi:unnamed protein product [Bursaphelenchus xylophilus]|uniref:Large ribosomal subunit protein mL44 n=1 Tax=Bursaphelenchus xylophilus TaxID=6326 RepID=A0A1I7S1N7_BURXY|nr:unnamed protein product [Bursaphelenchus xylophilus]CAG9081207.1 unnamed protein product [Bursaphelenchus xylophilus]
MFLQRFGRANSSIYQQCRGMREYWRQGYLKDLYHRRELLGADDPLPRSAYPNWNFNTELAAFKHRAGVEDLKKDELTRIMTSPTYFDRAEVIVEQNGESSREDNSIFIDKGEHRLRWQLSAILRHQWPKAPEEYVQGVVDHILTTENLLTISNQLGIQHLVRTLNFPPPKDDVIAAFWALLGAMSGSRVHGFVNEFVLPYLTEVPFEDVLPFREPLPIAEAYLKKVGSCRKVEARIIHSHGEFSAMPLYMVGIYGDEQLVEKAPGEYLSIATDLAAQLSLLKIWDIRWNEQSFSFLNDQIPIHQFEKPNHHLADVVGAETDLSLLSKRELEADPINVFQVADTFENTIRAEVGLPLRRRLRHKFSRGSLAKRSLRRLIKPKVFTI